MVEIQRLRPEAGNHPNSDGALAEEQLFMEELEAGYGEEDGKDSNPCRCTFAVTGTEKTYQAIFICRTCCSEQDLMCVCEACAGHCHEFHDELEYLGMGFAYCDCSRLGDRGCCTIEKASNFEAQRLNIPLGGIQLQPETPTTSLSKTKENPYVMDVYTIPELENSTEICHSLVDQAMELVSHSKDTFWLDARQDQSKWSELERSAWRIFQQHVKNYGLDIQEVGGAEWWVQVKKGLNTGTKSTIVHLGNDATTNAGGSEAVDLHYDKDETLAELFGLGSFPTLSTVTYLTDGSNPTVVLTRTYDQADDDVIPDMLISHPRPGKHLVFDGRLLHGAPAEPTLRQSYRPSPRLAIEEFRSGPQSTSIRATFLVNVWATRRPAGVHPLPETIRGAIKARTSPNSTKEEVFGDREFEKKDTEVMELKEESQLLEEMRGRVELPFLCKGITWESEDDESGGLVVVTFPPPEHESDTIRVRFGPGLQAYFDHSVDGNDERDPGPPIEAGSAGYEDAYI